MTQKHLVPLIVFAWALSASACFAQREKASRKVQQPPAEVSLHRDLEFAQAGTKSLLLDLYLPNDAANPPVVVWIHGGAWRKGSKGGGGRVRWMTEHGYAVADINYRLSQEAIFPAQIFDCKAAIRWLRAHAKQYSYDATRIGVAGSSAGGHLVALLGTSGDVKDLEGDLGDHLDQSSRVQAVCDMWGPTDFLQMGGRHNEPDSPECRSASTPASTGFSRTPTRRSLWRDKPNLKGSIVMTRVDRCALMCRMMLICSAVGHSAERSPQKADEVKIFNGEKRLLLVNGYSTSFQWWAFLQRKVDRYLKYEGAPDGRAVEVQSVTKGGTPIAKWMNAETGERSPAWKQMLTPIIQAEQGKRPVIVLAQQSLQWAFGQRGVGIRSPNDPQHIEQGADVLQRYAQNLLDDGAAEVIIAMHIYKKPMEPEIGDERFALAELIKRDIPHVFAGPDVWTPTSKQHPLAFDRDGVHPNFIGAEILAHYWFARLLELDGLTVPDWSQQEMEDAVKNQPLGLVRDRRLFEQKVKEWRIVDRRPTASQGGMRGRSRRGRSGAGHRVPPRILQRYDKDGDGKLNDEERAAFEKARRQHSKAPGGSASSGGSSSAQR